MGFCSDKRFQTHYGAGKTKNKKKKQTNKKYNRYKYEYIPKKITNTLYSTSIATKGVIKGKKYICIYIFKD